MPFSSNEVTLCFFFFFLRQTAQKRNGHCQAETGKDPENQQTQSRLCVTLQKRQRQNEKLEMYCWRKTIKETYVHLLSDTFVL